MKKFYLNIHDLSYDGKIKENDANPETVGKKLLYLPEKMFNVGADIEEGHFSSSPSGM
ncbi:MAG: hypothetical protein HZA00_11785 [Nitrospinae bacterium]|nr:hypothetical protein [Nitrospinota bacterium]